MPCRVALRRWFLVSAGLILLATGIGKCLAAIGPQRALDVPDPVFGIPFRQLFLGVGLLEQYVAMLCLCGRHVLLSLVVVAWLASNFLLYRVGLWLMGWHGPCGCAGKLTDALGIAPQTADGLMKLVLVYLLIGGAVCIVHERLRA